MCVSHPSPIITLSSSRPETTEELPCSPLPRPFPVDLARQEQQALLLQPHHTARPQRLLPPLWQPQQELSVQDAVLQQTGQILALNPEPSFQRMRRLHGSRSSGNSSISSSTALNIASVIIIHSEIQKEPYPKYLTQSALHDWAKRTQKKGKWDSVGQQRKRNIGQNQAEGN